MGQHKYDWERIEVEYRANRLSLRELSKKHGVPESTIRSRAKRYDWKRDLAQKAKERTKDKISRSVSRIPHAREEELLEEISDRSAAVVDSHRKDIQEGRQTAALMLGELRDTTHFRDTIAEIIDQAADDEEWGERRKEVIRRATTLQTRAGVMRDLANTMKILQRLERDAFGIDDRPNDRDPLDEILDAVTDTSRGIDGYGE